MPPPASHLKLPATDPEHLAANADALARGWSPTASQRVIEANDGWYAGRFVNANLSSEQKLRYLVDLSRVQPESGSA